MIIVNWHRIHSHQQWLKSYRNNWMWGFISYSPLELHTHSKCICERIPLSILITPLTLRYIQNNIPYYSVPTQNCPSCPLKSILLVACNTLIDPDSIFAQATNKVRKVFYFEFGWLTTLLFEYVALQ